MRDLAPAETALTTRRIKPTIPVVVGITGKRRLAREPSEAEQLAPEERAVAQALAAAFDQIDALTANSPKILLTALAEGADYLAAVEAWKRPHYHIVAVLPFAQAVYEQDFLFSGASHEADARATPYLQQFRSFLGRHSTASAQDAAEPFAPRPKLSIVELGLLVGAEAATVARSPVDGRSATHRTIHYEQAGIYIADHCHLLLAVLDRDEKPGKLGGTARIAHYKLFGTLPESDPRVDEVIRDLDRRAGGQSASSFSCGADHVTQLRSLSRELARPAPLRVPQRGHVWRIDAKAPSAAVHLLPQSGAAASRREAVLFRKDLHDTFRAIDVYNRAVERMDAAEVLSRLRTTDHALRMAQASSAQVAPGTDAQRECDRAEVEATLRDPAAAGPRAAIAELLDRRRVVADLQRKHKGRARTSIFGLAALFLATILLFELFDKTKPPAQTLILWAYAALIVVTLVLFRLMRGRHFSEYMEDYRAVSELLRVQAFWQIGGIAERAEDHFEVGTARELRRLRAILRTITAEIRWRHRSPALLDLPQLARWQWLEDQANYFAATHHTREAVLGAYRLVIPALFFFAVGMLPPLLFFMTAELFASMAGYSLPILYPALYLLVLILLTLYVIGHWQRGQPATRPDAVGFVAARTELIWQITCGAAGALVSAMIQPVAVASDAHIAHAIVIVGAAVLIGLAGVLTFLREKFAYEPEATNYRDMLATTRAAIAAFDRTRAHERKGPDDRERARAAQREILRRFGSYALNETAAWVRARRERSIEQPFLG
jgi:hypothetical protein